jgi:hypothetical protein
MKMAIKPQSIVHQVVRLERKIARTFSGRFGTRWEQEKAVELPSSVSERWEQEKAVELPSSVFVVEKSSIQDDETTVSTAAASTTSNIDSTLVHEYRTINQIEFMVDCLIENTNEYFLVHFYIEDSSVSENIDKQMEQLAAGESRHHCLRISSRLAPLMTAKLNIQKERPTVVAMKDGSVVSGISEFSSPDCGELGTWASIELL